MNIIYIRCREIKIEKQKKLKMTAIARITHAPFLLPNGGSRRQGKKGLGYKRNITRPWDCVNVKRDVFRIDTVSGRAIAFWGYFGCPSFPFVTDTSF